MLYQLSYARRHRRGYREYPSSGAGARPGACRRFGKRRTAAASLRPLEEATLHGPRLRSEQGQTMAEYGVVLAVITAGVIAAWLVFSGAIVSAILKTVALMP
jgi:Flp pilus assembly pilin Flp